MAILRLPSIPISSKDGFTQRSVITEWRKGCEALINSFTSITEFLFLIYHHQIYLQMILHIDMLLLNGVKLWKEYLKKLKHKIWQTILIATSAVNLQQKIHNGITCHFLEVQSIFVAKHVKTNI